MEQNNFHLYQTLKPHSAAVRALDAADGWLITGSIDKTCKIFHKVDNRYLLQNEIDLFEDYIFATLVRAFGKGFAVAVKNNKIFLLDLEGNPSGLLEGHTGPVNSLSETPSGSRLVSGSWDGSAIVWDFETQSVVYKLEGHSHAVSVLAIDDERFVTGSQDKNLNIWNGKKKEKTIPNAHEDIIRELRRYGDFAFLSCSNDEIIKMWSFDGEIITTCSGHTAFVFSLCVILDKGIMVSGSDDKTIKFWQNDNCIQTVAHPSTLWCVRCDTDGAIITACADGFTRVFSSNPKHIADQDEVDDFQKSSELAGLQGAQGINESELAKIPDSSQMGQYKGKKEGEVRIFKSNNVPEAYVWKTEGQFWEKIGEVISQQAKKSYEGDRFFPKGDYDYVFDIEDESGAPRKLPFNEGDNPLESAEKFLVKEGLHRGYLEQVCNFIRKNIRGDGIPKPKSNTIQTEDSGQPKDVRSNYFPMKHPFLFETANWEGLTKKIVESELNEPALNLEEKDKKAFFNMVDTLKNVQFYHSSNFADNELAVFQNKLLKWPADLLLPVLDLFRLVVLHPASERLFAGADVGFNFLSKLCSIMTSHPNELTKSLAIKVMCNLCKHTSNRYCLLKFSDFMVESLAKLILQTNSHKALKSSLAALMFNLSVIFPESQAAGKCEDVLSLTKGFMEIDQDNDNLVKYLITIGNLLTREPTLQKSVKSMHLKGALHQIEGHLTTSEAKECLSDLQKLL